MKNKSVRLNLFRQLLVIFILILISCSENTEQKFNDSKIVYDAWAEFHQKKDVESCQNFISVIESYEPEKFSSYPELKAATKAQIETC